jgi:hypothetical protein
MCYKLEDTARILAVSTTPALGSGIFYCLVGKLTIALSRTVATRLWSGMKEPRGWADAYLAFANRSHTVQKQGQLMDQPWWTSSCQTIILDNFNKCNHGVLQQAQSLKETESGNYSFPTSLFLKDQDTFEKTLKLPFSVTLDFLDTKCTCLVSRYSFMLILFVGFMFESHLP